VGVAQSVKQYANNPRTKGAIPAAKGFRAREPGYEEGQHVTSRAKQPKCKYEYSLTGVPLGFGINLVVYKQTLTRPGPAQFGLAQA
jgi:hypothetical protein